MKNTIVGNNSDILYYVSLLLIGVISVCLFGIPKEYMVAVLFFVVILLTYLLRKNIFDWTGLFLFVGMAVHSRIYEETIDKLAGALIPILLYYIGQKLIMLKGHIDLKSKNRQIILTLTIGLFINSLLNAMEYYIYGFEGGRRWKEFWSQWNIPATQHVFWQLLIVGVFFYSVYYIRKYKVINSMLVLGGLFSLFFSLQTGSRLLIVVFVIVMAINIVLFIYLNWDNSLIKKNVKISLITIGVFVAILFGMWFFNVGDCQTYLKDSFWSRDGGIIHNIRFQIQFSALKQILKYPFGGRKMDLAGSYFAHNVWLDMANASGIISFFSIIVYTIFTFIDLAKLVFNKTVDKESKFLLVSAYFSLWLYYMVETALDAHIMLWAVWMLICGVIKGNVVELKKKKIALDISE